MFSFAGMRNPGLDVLRAIAVILVLARHSNLNFWLTKFGWLGVDLFFVLSGFLVAGLLFAEYKKHGAIDLKRFLVKRAFKILPPFYVFLGISLLFESVYGSGPLITPKLREMLYPGKTNPLI
ncbi:MAG: acyltransferase family protein [Bacteroidota bacterium]